MPPIITEEEVYAATTDLRVPDVVYAIYERLLLSPDPQRRIDAQRKLDQAEVLVLLEAQRRMNA
jgi:hypothetical protein